ncbi:MAG: hypothetical protein K6F97_02945, partial [Lachnospiraceae bacterium]|nr:hypothetical protein [Lachnospiraceae bacterium]
MEQVYLGFFSSLFNKIYKSILEPIIKFLTGILNTVFTWVFDSILKPLLIEILIPLFKELINLIMEILSGIIYALYVKLLQLIDTTQTLFNVFGGAEQIEYKGDKYNILELFFRMDFVQKAVWALIAMAFVLLLGCAIVAVVRSAGDLDGQKPVMKVLHSTGQGFFRLISIPLVCFFLIMLSSTILSSVYTAVTSAQGGSNNTTVARTLFVISTFDAANDPKYNMSSAEDPSSVGVMDELRNKYYHTGEKSVSYADEDAVERDFKYSKINYIVGFGAGIFLLYILASGVFKFLNRLFNVLILFLCAPIFAATQPIDDGEKYQGWKDMFIGQLFSGFGAIIAMQIYLMVMPIILNGGVSFGLSTEGDFVIRILFLLGGAYAIKDAGGVITGLINSTAASMETHQDVAFMGALKSAYSAAATVNKFRKDLNQANKVSQQTPTAKGGEGGEGGGKSGDDQKFGGKSGANAGKEGDANNKFNSNQKPSTSSANLASAAKMDNEANAGKGGEGAEKPGEGAAKAGALGAAGKAAAGKLGAAGAGGAAGEGGQNAAGEGAEGGEGEEKEGAKAGADAKAGALGKKAAGAAAAMAAGAGAGKAGEGGEAAGAGAEGGAKDGAKAGAGAAGGEAGSKGSGGAAGKLDDGAAGDNKPAASGAEGSDDAEDQEEGEQQDANGAGGKKKSKKKKPGVRKSFLGGLITVGVDANGKTRRGLNLGKNFQFGMQKDGTYKTSIFGISATYGVNGKIANWSAFGVKARYDKDGKLDKVKVPFFRFKATTDENGKRIMKLSKVRISKGFKYKRAETVTKDKKGNVISRKLGNMYCSDLSAIGLKRQFDQETGNIERLSLLGLHNKRLVDKEGKVSYIKDYRNFLWTKSVYDRDKQGNYHVVARRGFTSDRSYALNKETGEKILTKMTSFGGKNLYEHDLGSDADNLTRYDLTSKGVKITGTKAERDAAAARKPKITTT